MADPQTCGRRRGISESLEQERASKTNPSLVLCACTHREGVTQRKRRKKRLEGIEWKGTLEPRKPSPQLCRKSCRSKPQAHCQPPYKKDMPRIFPPWPVLSKKHTYCTSPRHPGNEAQCQHRHNTILKTTEEQ